MTHRTHRHSTSISRHTLYFLGENIVLSRYVKSWSLYIQSLVWCVARQIHCSLFSYNLRIVYKIIDVNGDGLLDIFFTNPRRKDNYLVPGSLYINNENQTWREDTSMIEFTDAMILTDADGDSIAEELMVIRGFCFPERKDPNHDERFGPFPDETKDFCSTRPVGSTAVYKFNNVTQQMEEISPKYVNIDSAASMRPGCCPHRIPRGYMNSCVATSIAAGDIDRDGRTDHIVLYSQRMEFFFSSDRPVGELPIEKKYVGSWRIGPRRPYCHRGTEGGTLFSFDDSFRFYGSITQQRNHVGNAVPVNLASAVAKEIPRASYRWCKMYCNIKSYLFELFRPDL